MTNCMTELDYIELIELKAIQEQVEQTPGISGDPITYNNEGDEL